MAMPRGLSIRRIIALVNALAKVHNFCIGEVDGGGNSRNRNRDSTLLPHLNADTNNIMNSEDGFVPMVASDNNHGLSLPRALMDSGHHFSDVPRNARRQSERFNSECNLPRQRLLRQVIDSHLVRPNIK